MHSHRASVEVQQQDGVVVAHDGNEDSIGNNKNDTQKRQHKRKMMYSFGLLCFFMITIFQVGNMTVTSSVRTENISMITVILFSVRKSGFSPLILY